MNENDLLAYVRSSLKAIRPIEWDSIATAANVPIGTLRKLAYGEVEDPRISTVQALYNYFRGREVVEAEPEPAKAA